MVNLAIILSVLFSPSLPVKGTVELIDCIPSYTIPEYSGATGDPIPSCATLGNDSLPYYSLPEVVIEKNRISFLAEDKRVTVTDSIIMELFSGTNLGEVISLSAPAYINVTGGAGASSALFLRGTNSYQSTVTWNGFPLNSITLGTSDLSAIPVAGMQDLTIVHGASGTLAGSGNSGGTILLENRADWNNRLQLGLKSELGAFDSRNFSFSGKTGNSSVQYQVALFSQQSRNNFRYNDIYKQGSPVEIIRNNALDNRGAIQNIFLRLPGGNSLEAGMWYQVKDKELPSIMGSYMAATANQRDSLLRVYARWTRTGRRSAFSVNAAKFSEHMEYNESSGNPGSYSSNISSGRNTADINYRYWITDNLAVEGGIIFSTLSARVDSYGTPVSEYQHAGVASVKLSLPGFTGNLSARKEYHPLTKIPLLVSFGARKRLIEGTDLKFSYSGQYRVPTFNDKYWQPGGNPGLLPESGFTADLGITRDITLLRVNFSAEINAYASELVNMIQWVPSANSTWWRPENKREVSVKGIEADLSATGSIGQCTFTFGAGYNYASSLVTRTYNDNAAAEGKRLIYVPGGLASARTMFFYRSGFGGITGSYAGRRFTTEDNNPVHLMPSFYILNCHAGYMVRMGDVGGRLQLRVMNLLDRQYQVVRAYAMPGRSWHVSFTLEFSQ